MHKFWLKMRGLGVGRTSAALAVLLLLTATARAADVPGAPAQAERLTYNIMVGGLHLGDAMIVLNQTETGYTTAMQMTARGVAKMVRNFRSTMRGEGRFTPVTAANGTGIAMQPAAFSRHWSTGEIASDMIMTFDPTTGMAKSAESFFNPVTAAPIAREDLPWNDRGDRQRDVPADMRTNVLDPMAAFVAARGQIMAQGFAKGPRTFRVPIYDGRRRYDIVGKAEPPRAVTLNGEEHLMIPIVAKLEPIFGFGKKTTERMKDSEGKFLFTNDARFIPMQLVVSNEYLSGVMNLTADCAENAAPCETFGQEKTD